MSYRSYMDYNATTPPDRRVIEAMTPYLSDFFGNPSSIYSHGNRAKAALDDSREKVAALINSKPSEIAFTSGGSESNNFAIKGTAFRNSHKGKHLITTAVEHASSLQAFRYLESQGFRVTYIPVDRKGFVDPEKIREEITDKTILISCIHVNNETGVISPVKEIADIANKSGVILHIDSVQAAGKVDIDMSVIVADLMSLSSHKLYGTKGTGALFIRKDTAISPLIHGGGQERGRRSGTENVAGIVAFGKACEILTIEMQDEQKRILDMRNQLEERITGSIPRVTINGDIIKRVNNTLNLKFGNLSGESLVMNLDLEGIAASTGSACSEGNVDPSHVLMAMGQSKDEALSSLRLSLGRFTTYEDIDRLTALLPSVVERIRTAGAVSL